MRNIFIIVFLLLSLFVKSQDFVIARNKPVSIYIGAATYLLGYSIMINGDLILNSKKETGPYYSVGFLSGEELDFMDLDVNTRNILGFYGTYIFTTNRLEKRKKARNFILELGALSFDDYSRKGAYLRPFFSAGIMNSISKRAYLKTTLSYPLGIGFQFGIRL